MHTQTKDSQAALTIQESIDHLMNGNSRFLQGTPSKRDYQSQIGETSTGQYPFAAVLSCIDSRIPTEVVFDQGIGDIFNARIAGNFINEDILGSLEFACKLAGSKVIMVLGHTSCGAVKGACDHAKLGNLTQMLDKIMPAVNDTTTAEGEARDSSNLDFVNRVSAQNVRHAIKQIRTNSEVLSKMESDGEILIIGAMYDVSSGKVSRLE